jgi:hypothetical protein
MLGHLACLKCSRPWLKMWLSLRLRWLRLGQLPLQSSLVPRLPILLLFMVSLSREVQSHSRISWTAAVPRLLLPVSCERY